MVDAGPEPTYEEKNVSTPLRVRSEGCLILLVAVCILCFFPSFSLSLLHVVASGGLVCDLWHFLPDHTRILFCILDKVSIMVS